MQRTQARLVVQSLLAHGLHCGLEGTHQQGTFAFRLLDLARIEIGVAGMEEPAAAFADGEATPGFAPVRNAGPEAMKVACMVGSSIA